MQETQTKGGSVKLKLETIWTMQQSLNRVAGMQLETKISYRIAKIVKKMTAELKTVEEQRLKLIDKYAVADEKGAKQVPPDKIEEFGKEWTTLLQEEVELEGIVKVKLPNDVKLTPKEVMDLEEILELEEV